MQEVRRNKRYGKDSSDFERNWAPLLVRMMRQITDKTLRIDHNYAFLTSTPKWREIFATSFEGRIADHLLCDTLAPYIARELHERTFNNRKGMGSQAAINQVIEDICEVSNGYTEPCRIIKWDLKGFFPNAKCDIIERYFCDIIDKYKDDITARFDKDIPSLLKWLTMICVHCYPAKHCELRTPKQLWDLHIPDDKSLFSKPDGIGTPIGRLTSQMGMGLYLNDEVKWLNDECGVKSTLFMDDCVMVTPERLHAYTLGLLPELRRRLANKGIKVNEKKFYDQPYWNGMEFLGSHIKPYRIHLNNKTYKRAIERICELNNITDKKANIDNFVSAVNSYTGLLKNRTDYRRIQQLVNRISDEWWEMCRWNKRKQCVAYLPEYSVNNRLNRKYRLRLKNKHYITNQ